MVQSSFRIQDVSDIAAYRLLRDVGTDVRNPGWWPINQKKLYIQDIVLKFRHPLTLSSNHSSAIEFLDPENIGLAVGISLLSCLETFITHFPVIWACLNMLDDFPYIVGGATITFGRKSKRNFLQVSNAKKRIQAFASVLEILRKVWRGSAPTALGKI